MIPAKTLTVNDGILFLKRNVDFDTPMCAGYEYAKSLSM
jgi:hypothetical protein